MSEKTKKVTRLVDVRVVADMPSWVCRYYSRPEEWATNAEAWAREFNEFIRDHRSQDPVYLNVERITEEVCEKCGCTWEPYQDEEFPIPSCAGCGAEIEVEQGVSLGGQGR